MMATHDEASRLALLKLYGQKMGAYDQISSDLTTYRHQVMEIAGRAFQNSSPAIPIRASSKQNTVLAREEP
jgi:ABC-type transport system involved in cytochrome bd biosynthesis fused ATPase/permease subunit